MFAFCGDVGFEGRGLDGGSFGALYIILFGLFCIGWALNWFLFDIGALAMLFLFVANCAEVVFAQGAHTGGARFTNGRSSVPNSETLF